MMRLLRRLKNTLREGLKGIWKHKQLGFVSVTSTFFTLLIIGVIIIITVTINSMSMQIQGKVNDVEIFVKKDASELQVEELRHKIENYDLDKSISYRSSEEALEIMKKSWQDNADLLENINPDELLPASFVVKLEDISKADEFVQEIEKEESVDDVNYYKELVDQVYKFSTYTKIFGTILVIVLIIISLFVISNTIKLTVISRVNEIAVMKNVGATNGYIRIPFIIEGLFYSLLGSILSFLAIFYLYKFVYYNFGIRLVNNFSILGLIKPSLLKNSLLQIFLALGAGIGYIGSVLSIRKYLVNREVKYVK